MPFTMLLPAINVFLPFRTASLYLLFPSTMLCCQKGLLLSGKWVMTGLGRWFCLLYTGVWWRYCNVSLSIHLECLEMKQMCFSFLMVYFVNIDVLAFIGFLLATFVWPFLRLMIPSDFLLILLSHSYRILSLLFLLFRYMLGLFGEFIVQRQRELSSSRLSVGWFCWSCLLFAALIFSQNAPGYLPFHQWL